MTQQADPGATGGQPVAADRTQSPMVQTPDGSRSDDRPLNRVGAAHLNRSRVKDALKAVAESKGVIPPVPAQVTEKKGKTDGKSQQTAAKSAETKTQEKPPESDAWSKLYAVEAERRQEKETLKKERESFKSEMEAFKKQQEEVNNILKAVKSDPIGFSEQHGATPEAWLKRSLADEGTAAPAASAVSAEIEEIRKLREEFVKERDEWKKELEDKEKSQTLDQQTRVYQSQIDVELEKPEFALIKELNAEQEIWNYINAVAQETGKLLPPQDAVVKVHAGLRTYVQKLKQNEAVQALWNEAPGDVSQQTPPAAPLASAKIGESVENNPTTLSNSMAGGSVPEDFSKLSRSEQIRHAAQTIKWNQVDA